ncbi:9890_t:CDS:2, partial [Racocetra fulgida]
NKATDKATNKVADEVMDKAIDEVTDMESDMLTDMTTDIMSETNEIIPPFFPSVSFMASEDEVLSSDDNLEFEISYKLFIKTAEETALLAKWFKESMSTIDEFFSSIYNQITMLIKNNTLLPTDYSIAFKMQRETGAGTQLADAQDFIKFKAECLKLAAKNINIEIYITIIQTKKKNANNEEKEFIVNYKNSNKVSRISSLSSHNKLIAENVLEIRTEYHCNIHNRPCLNKESNKDLYVEITFIMLSIWATSNTSTFSHAKTSKKLHSSSLSLQALQEIALLLLQASSSPTPLQASLQVSLQALFQAPFQVPFQAPFQSPFQALFQAPLASLSSSQSLFFSTTLPMMAEFLREINENEATNFYYQSFLHEFEKQKVSVKNLARLPDKALKLCGIDAVGA